MFSPGNHSVIARKSWLNVVLKLLEVFRFLRDSIVNLLGKRLTSYVLPPLLSAFSERYPGVELRLNEAHTTKLKGELQEGRLDFLRISGCSWINSWQPTIWRDMDWVGRSSAIRWH